ncbi:MAG: hypothetical protein HYV77_02330 [Candidatus Wildermuthbacteria bacterium]|nr:hypothetical protein [Candidatus Wildermuthbacteria bacterium]
MKISVRRRSFDIKRKQNRRGKLKKLQERYTAASSKDAKQQIVEKAAKIAPHLSNIEEYLKGK